MFKNLKKFYENNQKNVFEVLPLTFHIEKGVDDKQFLSFLNSYTENSV